MDFLKLPSGISVVSTFWSNVLTQEICRKGVCRAQALQRRVHVARATRQLSSKDELQQLTFLDSSDPSSPATRRSNKATRRHLAQPGPVLAYCSTAPRELEDPISPTGGSEPQEAVAALAPKRALEDNLSMAVLKKACSHCTIDCAVRRSRSAFALQVRDESMLAAVGR